MRFASYRAIDDPPGSPNLFFNQFKRKVQLGSIVGQVDILGPLSVMPGKVFDRVLGGQVALSTIADLSKKAHIAIWRMAVRALFCNAASVPRS